MKTSAISALPWADEPAMVAGSAETQRVFGRRICRVVGHVYADGNLHSFFAPCRPVKRRGARTIRASILSYGTKVP